MWVLFEDFRQIGIFVEKAENIWVLFEDLDVWRIIENLWELWMVSNEVCEVWMCGKKFPCWGCF